MTMRTVVLILGSGVWLGGLLCGCGESQDSDTRFGHVSGTTKEEAPLAGTVTDLGILQDPASYQPTKAPGSAGLAPRRSGGATDRSAGGAAGGGDAESQVRTVIEDLIAAIEDGEVMLALRLFNPEQVEPLTGDEVDTLYVTFEKIERLALSLEDKLGQTRTEPLVRSLRGLGEAAPEWDIHDAEHASLKSNIALILFGPQKAEPTMALAKQDGQWRFQLDNPLSADDVATIVLYHDALQIAVDEVTDWIEAAERVNEETVGEILAKVLQGEPVELGDVSAGAEEAGAAQPEEKKEGATKRRGGGRSRRRGP